MATSPSFEERKAAELEELTGRALKAQNILIGLTADAIGMYLTEYILELELKINSKALRDARHKPTVVDGDDNAVRRKAAASMIRRWLLRVRLMDEKDRMDVSSDDSPLAKTLDEMIDKGTPETIQAFVRALYHGDEHSRLRTLTQRAGSTMAVYPEYVRNVVTMLDTYDADLKALRDKGGLSSDAIRKLNGHIRKFSLFRDGLAKFPDPPTGIDPRIMPRYAGVMELPVNPMTELISGINHAIYRRRFNIMTGGSLDTFDPVEIKGTRLDLNLNSRDDMDMINLYETGKKSPRRIMEKAEMETGEDLSKIKDAARTKIVVDDMAAMIRVGEILSDLVKQKGFSEEKKPIAMNVRGAWDCKRNITVHFKDGDAEKTLCTEVQIIDKQMQKIDRFSHQIYSLIRSAAPRKILSAPAADGAKTGDIAQALTVAEFKDFVQSYNEIAQRLNSSGMLIGQLRSIDPSRFSAMQSGFTSLSDSQIQALIKDKSKSPPEIIADDKEIPNQAKTRLATMIENLNHLHQSLCSFAAISRRFVAGKTVQFGQCHPSMSAAFDVLARGVIANDKTGLAMDPELLPKMGPDLDYTQAERQQAAAAIEQYNQSIGKETAHGQER